MNRIHLHLHFTSATVTATVAAAIAVAVSFGAHLTQENTRSILTLVGLLGAALIVGGGAKTAGMIRTGVTSGSRFHFTGASVTAIVGAVLAVATSFGLHLTQANTQSILTLVGLLAAGLIGGGALKSRAMLIAGDHPLNKTARPLTPVETSTDSGVITADEFNWEPPTPFEPAPLGLPTTLRVQVGSSARKPRAHEAHPVLEVHGTFAGLALGKAPAAPDPRTPMLGEYLTMGATAPRAKPHLKLPRSVKRADAITAELGGDWTMMGNDAHGDCTCAALGHMVQAWTALVGAPLTPTQQQVLGLYDATGTADDGRVMFEVLKYAKHTGLFGEAEIDAYVQVGLKRYQHRDVKAAIDLFGGVYLGIALPTSAQSQTVWDVVGDPSRPGPAQWGSWGGHAVNGVDYDQAGITIVTWGHLQKVTWGFLDAYADEAYAIISEDWLGAGKTIEGFDRAALLADLEIIKHGYQPQE